MSFKKCESKLAVSGAIIAIIQGLTWMILSILGMVVFFESLVPTLDENLHKSFLSISLYSIIANDEYKSFIIQIIYFFASLLWVVASGFLLHSVCKKDWKTEPLASYLWCGWTLLLSVFDMIVLGLYASDYRDVLEIFNKTGETSLLYVLIGYGVLFSLAARGYVLWLVNVVYAMLLLYSTVTAHKVSHKNDDDFSELSNRYTTERTGQFNSAFEWSQDRSQYQHETTAPSGYGRPGPHVPPKPYHGGGEHVGRQGAKPGGVPSPKPPTGYLYPNQYPKIPNPDYSPPNSPMKSAMKNKPSPFVFSRPKY